MLFIHIGRGKSGSSTIQAFASRYRAWLGRNGLTYPAWGCHRGGHMPIARAVRSGRPAHPLLLRLRDAIEGDPAQGVFISSEHFFNSPPSAIAALAATVGAGNVRVIAYIRDYPGWIRSLYAQSTGTGYNHLDFDRFYEARRHRMSALASLKRWAAAFGWDRLRVRTLDADDLAGGTLLADLLEAIGVGVPPPEMDHAPDRNVSPPWPVIEFTRAITGLRPEFSAERRAEKDLVALFAAFVAKRYGQFPDTGYLTEAQHTEAAALFAADIAEISALTEHALRPGLSEAPLRRFLPTFDRIPRRLRTSALATLQPGEIPALLRRAGEPFRLLTMLRLRAALRRRLSKPAALPTRKTRRQQDLRKVRPRA